MAGLADDGTVRRVPGLQRDEVARLAAISVDYYTLDHTARLVTETGGTSTRYAATDHTQ